MDVVETRDRDRIERILNLDRVWGAYAIGDLEEPYFARCRWFVTTPGDRALALAFRLDEWAAVHLFGDPALAPPLLGALPAIARRTDLHLPAAHHAGVAPLVSGELVPHVRMWRPAGSSADGHADVMPELPPGVTLRRLDRSDVSGARALYRHYAESAFSEHRLAESLYVGAEHRPQRPANESPPRHRDHQTNSSAGEGPEIVAIGGTHVVSATRRVAALGDIVTAPAWRARGLATAITAELCSRLSDRVDLIALNVAADNRAAIRAYEKVGFRAHMAHYEGADVSWSRPGRSA